jgi:hypothetical protein
LTSKYDVQFVIPATLLAMHIYLPALLAETELMVSVLCLSLGCVIKAPDFHKLPFENSHIILSQESPFTTAQLTITKSPELMGSLPKVNGRI